ncbi:hypothetical protein A0256_03360 [Mucilaginibacter sp. PAMC 26640]|nr:hypothetical protein A0256_03360 [Mucilaginibacter sp. PAMC 26640]
MISNKFLVLLLVLNQLAGFKSVKASTSSRDTLIVIALNKLAYDNRFDNPEQTINNANKALTIAKKIAFNSGVGEAYRLLGIGHYYLNQSNKAIDDYLKALHIFENLKDFHSQAKVLNNISNLYIDDDNNKALDYLKQALVIIQSTPDTKLRAVLYMNIGNLYYRKKSFHEAIKYYDKSTSMFSQLQDSINLVTGLQNSGLIYLNLKQYDIAEKRLIAANNAGKKRDLNKPVASSSLALAALYNLTGKFDYACRAAREGEAYAIAVNDDKLTTDYNYTIYQIESKRKNYKRALQYFQRIVQQDSAGRIKNEIAHIKMAQRKFSLGATQFNKDLIIEKQRTDRIKFVSITIVSGVSLIVIIMLFFEVVGIIKSRSPFQRDH